MYRQVAHGIAFRHDTVWQQTVIVRTALAGAQLKDTTIHITTEHDFLGEHYESEEPIVFRNVRQSLLKFFPPKRR
jgi:hypothetical protein